MTFPSSIWSCRTHQLEILAFVFGHVGTNDVFVSVLLKIARAYVALGEDRRIEVFAAPQVADVLTGHANITVVTDKPKAVAVADLRQGITVPTKSDIL